MIRAIALPTRARRASGSPGSGRDRHRGRWPHPEQLITEVDTSSGSIILAFDAAHFAEEYEADRPFSLFHDLDDLWACYDLLKQCDARDGITVVPGHGPSTATSFAAVHEHVIDLTKRL